MAETMTVPGLGPVKSEYVWAGGAAVVGFVGYAWWKNRGSSSNQPIVLNPNDVVPATDYKNPGGSSAPVNVDSTGGAITTNAQWTQKATEYLAQMGFDPKIIAPALGKFLTRQGLTTAEQDAVRTAIGVVGYPPVGGPYPITPATPGTPDPTGSIPRQQVPDNLPADDPDNPWFTISALPNESWEDILIRFYGMDRNNPEDAARAKELAPIIRNINNRPGSTGNGPFPGQIVYLR